MFGILSVKRRLLWPGLASIMAGAMLIGSVPATAGIWDEGDIESGQALFNANCASCHKVTNEVLAAPGLAGIADRWGSSEEILVQWIQNPQAAAATGDPYVKSLVDRYVGTYGWMTAQAVSADDVKDIMAYVQNPPDVVATADTGTDCPTIYDAIEENQGANGTIWFLILLTLFLIIALSAATVRRSLERAAQEVAEDDDAPYVVRLRAWAWDNIAFVSILGLFVVAYLVVIGYQGLMGVGVYQGYTPDQPVKFIHSVHVCENEVDCQYCHHSAYEASTRASSQRLHELPGGQKGQPLRRSGNRQDLRRHRIRPGVRNLPRRGGKEWLPEPAGRFPG